MEIKKADRFTIRVSSSGQRLERLRCGRDLGRSGGLGRLGGGGSGRGLGAVDPQLLYLLIGGGIAAFFLLRGDSDDIKGAEKVCEKFLDAYGDLDAKAMLTLSSNG